jgi:hypothetical protein
MLSASGLPYGLAREDPGSLPPFTSAAFPPGRSRLLGGTRELSATGGKRKCAEKQAGDSDDKDDNDDADSNDDDDDSDDDDNDVAGGGSSRCPAKKMARPQSASRARSVAKGTATGQGAGSGLSTKRVHASWDPRSMKAKLAVRTTLALTEEQKATAFAKQVAKCHGILPPHVTDWGLGDSILLLDPDLEGPWHHGDIRISDEVLNKYWPLLAGNRILYVAYLRRIN